MSYIINKFSLHKFDDEHILITTEHGTWIVLNKKEFNLLRTNNISENTKLFSILSNRGVIVTKKNQNKIIQMYRKRFHNLFDGISQHTIFPVGMDGRTAKAVVDFIFQSPSKFLTIEFQGMESLINFPVIRTIIEYSKEKNKTRALKKGLGVKKRAINFKLVSNFEHANDEIIDYLIENKVVFVTILDGPKKLHNKNRYYNNAGSYDNVVYWIDKIRGKNYNSISAISTISKFSLPRHKDIVNEYLVRGFDSCSVRPLNFFNLEAKAWKKVGYGVQKFLDFWEKYIEYIFKINRRGTKFFDQDFLNFLKKVTALMPSDACLRTAPCGACTTQAAYNKSGDIYTCDRAVFHDVFKLGNVRDSYKKIFASQNALNFIGLSSMASSFCDNCEWHSYCSPCLVHSFATQNNLIIKPGDFFCEVGRRQAEYIFRKLVLSEKDKKMMLSWLPNKSLSIKNQK
jgi:radical SAM protein with 4Fe4S-binding SPASM domain